MLFLVLFVLVTGLVAAGYALWARRVRAEIAEGADITWERLSRNEPDFLIGLKREVFDRIYQRVHFPRFPKYFLVSVFTFFLALPVTFAALSAIVLIADWMGLTAQPQELARFVPISGDAGSPNAERNREMALLLARNFSGFFYFFGVIAGWLVIVATAARLYYARRPGYLRDELIRARTDIPLEEVPCEDETPDDETPDDGAPNEGAPNEGAPNEGTTGANT